MVNVNRDACQRDHKYLQKSIMISTLLADIDSNYLLVPAKVGDHMIFKKSTQEYHKNYLIPF